MMGSGRLLTTAIHNKVYARRQPCNVAHCIYIYIYVSAHAVITVPVISVMVIFVCILNTNLMLIYDR